MTGSSVIDEHMHSVYDSKFEPVSNIHAMACQCKAKQCVDMVVT